MLSLLCGMLLGVGASALARDAAPLEPADKRYPSDFGIACESPWDMALYMEFKEQNPGMGIPARQSWIIQAGVNCGFSTLSGLKEKSGLVIIDRIPYVEGGVTKTIELVGRGDTLLFLFSSEP
jgi:hypothetical protein